MLFVGFTLVACEVEEAKPTPEDVIEDVIPEEDKEPEIDEEDEEPEIDEEDEDAVYEDIIIVDESNLTQGEFKTVTLDVKGYSQIKITIVGESAFDIPVNMNNFKVDGEEVEYEGVTGTSYLLDHDFKIGSLEAKGRLINTHKHEEVTDFRLHTWHKTHGTDHYLEIDVENISEFEFQYKVTTGAYTYIDSLNIEMTAIK